MKITQAMVDAGAKKLAREFKQKWGQCNEGLRGWFRAQSLMVLKAAFPKAEPPQ